MTFNHRLILKAVIIVVVAIAAITNCDGCPKIVSRSEWGAIPATHPIPKLSTYPAPYVIVHHTAGAKCSDRNSCSQQARRIQHQHIYTNKWSDIGYNFLIGGDGNIYEGRGWAKIGAHAPNFNSKSHGVVFIGNFMESLPTEAAINAFHALAKCGVELKHVMMAYKLIGHRQVRHTLCPGTALYETIKKWPHYTPPDFENVAQERAHSLNRSSDRSTYTCGMLHMYCIAMSVLYTQTVCTVSGCYFY